MPHAKDWIGLPKLCEEAAEVIQVAAKLAACPNGIYFDGTNLIAALKNEMADLSAILQFVEETNKIEIPHKRVEEKFAEYYTRLQAKEAL